MLRRNPMNKDLVEEILSSDESISIYKKMIKETSWRIIRDEDIALLFRVFNDAEIVIKEITKRKITKKTSARSRGNINSGATKKVEEFIAECKNLGIEIHRERNKNKIKIKKVTTKEVIKNVIDNSRKQISFLNCHTTQLEKQLQGISDNSNGIDILKEYEELLVIFIAKARGEIVTKTTKRAVIVERDDNDNIISEKTRLNSDNKELVYIETQSHLPDAQALASTFVVSEILETLKGKMGNEATDDELEKSYRERLQKSQDQRKELKGRGNFEDDVIEAEVE